MPRETHSITATDILPLAIWGEQRKQQRADISALKKHRRVEVGPHACFYFENWDTMWYQVQEMLWIEKGGDAQLVDELAAYNPLIPQGDELVATFMIEVSDEARRRALLAELGGIEDHIALIVGDERIAPRAENELERTREDGKTSAVHFLHFPFNRAAVAAFTSGAEVQIRIDHPHYGHIAILPRAVQDVLMGDFAHATA
ncbi:MAG: DUF3501 family protein [Alphaproteobacteria bacterium]|nr:DUF3501 family protein [Alphaproteobacteria bacterium]MDE2339793.1 DUF3501 family protein [Alphaproteobacteria bacterium]